MEQPRCLGIDAATGKTAYALARPGGLLERMADAHALESAAVLVALVGAVLESGQATDAELAAFVPALYEALSEVVAMVTREE